MVLQSLIGDILINKASFLIRITITNQRNNISMENTAQGVNFSLEFLLTLSTTLCQFLHSNICSIGQDSSVYCAETTRSKKVVIRKLIGSSFQMVKKEEKKTVGITTDYIVRSWNIIMEDRMCGKFNFWVCCWNTGSSCMCMLFMFSESY